ncbi:MAG: hypothetical protein FWH41_07770 [Treponema sp.]|nr:hypothetical protein [Treponema sp.]
MKKTAFFGLFLIILSFSLISCDAENQGKNVVFDLDGGNLNGNTGSENTDEYLLLAYDKNYRYPDGFFYENNAGPVYYNNTASIKPPTERETAWIELHTTSKEEAKNWSNLSDEYSSVNRPLIEENETEKYFEFFRKDNSENLIFSSRVHHSDYFIPLFDKSNFIPFFEDFKNAYTVGIYNGDLAAEKSKEFIEYLWVMSLLMYGKVVESAITESGDKFEHYVQSLEMVGGDWGVNDIIYIFDNKFILDKETRFLTFVERTMVKKIVGKMN